MEVDAGGIRRLWYDSEE